MEGQPYAYSERQYIDFALGDRIFLKCTVDYCGGWGLRQTHLDM